MRPLFPAQCGRRRFLRGVALAAVASGVNPGGALRGFAGGLTDCPVALFTKAYQPLKLSFKEAASLTAEAGLEGIDCPVRPGGEVLPERVAEDLPSYAEALAAHRLKVHLLTTGITSLSTPHAEAVLRTAAKLGVRYYRLGFIYRRQGVAVEAQIRETRAQLKDLLDLNAELGLCAVVQNHSPSGETYLGGDLEEMHKIVVGFSPARLGVAFDIAHARVVHRGGWLDYFQALRAHLKVVYVKDVTADEHWVRLGDGEVGKLGFFPLLKHMRYRAPISLHVEYDWAGKGNPETRAGLLEAIRHDLSVLEHWLEQA
jgi:sugar phosphate isomerase/epimerase